MKGQEAGQVELKARFKKNRNRLTVISLEVNEASCRYNSWKSDLNYLKMAQTGGRPRAEADSSIEQSECYGRIDSGLKQVSNYYMTTGI